MHKLAMMHSYDRSRLIGTYIVYMQWYPMEHCHFRTNHAISILQLSFFFSRGMLS